MVTKKQIQDFLSLKTLAVIGVSRDDKKFGNAIYGELKRKNYSVYPIHKELETYEGDACYKDLKSLPYPPDGLVVSANKQKALDIVKEADSTGIKNIWLLLMSDSKEAVEYCADKGINLIYKQCLFMHLEPVDSIHKIHRFLKKLFGRMPK